MKRRAIVFFLAFSMLFLSLVGCGSTLQSVDTGENLTATKENQKTQDEGKTEENQTKEEKETVDEQARVAVWKEALSGKRALFVGSSTCAGYGDSKNKGWSGRIADAAGLVVVNQAVSGTSVSDIRKPKQGIITTQLQADGEFDYIMLNGGRNDAWSKAKVGKMSDAWSPEAFDTSTFAGGLETLIYTAIKTYGDKACIGFLIDFRAPKCDKGYVAQMHEYVNMTKKICDKWQISYLDMYNHKEIAKKLQFHTLRYTNDYIHPTDGGYEILYPYIADYMCTMTPCSQEILDRVR